MKVPNGDFEKFLKQDSSEMKNINRILPSGGVNVVNNQVFTTIPHPPGIINLQPQLLPNGLFSIPKPYVPCINSVNDNIKPPNQQNEQCPSNINELPNLITLFSPSSTSKNEKSLKKESNNILTKTGMENTNLMHPHLVNHNMGSNGQQILLNQGMAINTNLINNPTTNIPLPTNYIPNQCLVSNHPQPPNVFQPPTNNLQINEQIKNFINSLKQNHPTNIPTAMQQQPSNVVSTAPSLSETTINHLINSMPGPSNMPNINTIPQPQQHTGFVPQIPLQQPQLLQHLRIPIENDCPQNTTIIQLSIPQQQQLIQQAVLLASTAPPKPTKEVVDDILRKRKICKPKAKIEGCEALDISTVAGYPITCFIVAGEPRISFSEFSNTVLPHISVTAIHEAYQKFNMSTKCATDKQLLTLKLEGRIPVQLGTCTLITKSNAERLAGHFLCDIRHMDSFTGKYDTSTFIKVMHNLFGGNTGLYFPYLPKSHCIQCIHCQFVFSPQKFLTHSHNTKSDKVSVWGYDDRKWRRYYNPPIDEKIDSMYLDIFKTLIIDNNIEPNRKRVGIDMSDEVVPKKATNTNGGPVVNTVTNNKHDNEKSKDSSSPVFPTPPGSEPSPSTQNIATKPSVTKMPTTTTVVDVLPHQHPTSIHSYSMTQPQNIKPNTNVGLPQQIQIHHHQQPTDGNKSAFVGIQQPLPNVTLSQNTMFPPQQPNPPQPPTMLGPPPPPPPQLPGQLVPTNIPQNGLNNMQFNILINQLIQSQNYVDDPSKSLIESLAVLVPSNHLATVLTKLNNEFSIYKKEIDLLKEQNKRMEKIIQVCINASDGKLSETKIDEILK